MRTDDKVIKVLLKRYDFLWKQRKSYLKMDLEFNGQCVEDLKEYTIRLLELNRLSEMLTGCDILHWVEQRDTERW